VHGKKQRNKIAIVGAPADGHGPSKPVTGVSNAAAAVGYP